MLLRYRLSRIQLMISKLWNRLKSTVASLYLPCNMMTFMQQWTTSRKHWHSSAPSYNHKFCFLTPSICLIEVEIKRRECKTWMTRMSTTRVQTRQNLFTFKELDGHPLCSNQSGPTITKRDFLLVKIKRCGVECVN